jgi:hypothetical protein
VSQDPKDPTSSSAPNTPPVGATVSSPPRVEPASAEAAAPTAVHAVATNSDTPEAPGATWPDTAVPAPLASTATISDELPASTAAPADLPDLPAPLPTPAPEAAAAPALVGPLEPAPVTQVTLPQLSPERSVRRQRAGQFLGAALPAMGLLAMFPALLPAALQVDTWEEAAEPTAGSPAQLDAASRAIRGAVEDVRAQVREADGPAAQLARTECKRAAYRGAALVEQEIRNLQLTARHALQLEAALTRQPALAQKEKPAPVEPAQLEPWARKVGLTTPEDGVEGEVLMTEQGGVVGATLPAAFAALVAQLEDGGSSEAGGRVAWRARVPGSAYAVVAVRRLPPAVNPAALDDVLKHSARLQEEVAASAVRVQEAEALSAEMRRDRRNTMAATLMAGLVVTLLLGLVLRRQVVAPLREFRSELDRVRAGQRPIVPVNKDALADLYVALGDLADRLSDAQAATARAQARQKSLDDVMDVCRRAELGELTARPTLSDGPEGLLALSVAHLLESLEQQAARIRVQARTVMEMLSTVGQLSAAPTPDAPAIREPLDVMKARLESLTPLPNLIRNLAARLAALAQQKDPAVIIEDLQRLATALAPRAGAAGALLTDVEEQHRRLLEALSAQRTAAVSDALSRAQEAAADLTREARVWRGDGSIPTVLAGVRNLSNADLQRAWRDGAELPPV